MKKLLAIIAVALPLTVVASEAEVSEVHHECECESKFKLYVKDKANRTVDAWKEFWARKDSEEGIKEILNCDKAEEALKAAQDICAVDKIAGDGTQDTCDRMIADRKATVEACAAAENEVVAKQDK